jgi:hypothetical protein
VLVWAISCVCPAGVQPIPPVPDADQSADQNTIAEFASVRVTLTVSVAFTPALFVRTKPVEPPYANA